MLAQWHRMTRAPRSDLQTSIPEHPASLTLNQRVHRLLDLLDCFTHAGSNKESNNKVILGSSLLKRLVQWVNTLLHLSVVLLHSPRAMWLFPTINIFKCTLFGLAAYQSTRFQEFWSSIVTLLELWTHWVYSVEPFWNNNLSLNYFLLS